MKQNVPQCIRCEYYHVTWDPEHPHGCRGYGFKSKEQPLLLVKKMSGMECQLFREKEEKQT